MPTRQCPLCEKDKPCPEKHLESSDWICDDCRDQMLEEAKERARKRIPIKSNGKGDFGNGQ